MEQIIEVYTDGSCNTKLKVGAWAAILIDGDLIETISGFELETTNNRINFSKVFG